MLDVGHGLRTTKMREAVVVLAAVPAPAGAAGTAVAVAVAGAVAVVVVGGLGREVRSWTV